MAQNTIDNQQYKKSVEWFTGYPSPTDHLSATPDSSKVKTTRLYKIERQKVICSIVIAVGIALRLFHYFQNRSLWEDEIYLSTGLVRLSLADLFTHALDYQQKAPLAYLIIEKLFIIIFGTHEMALRLLALISGIASMLVFYKVARYFLKPAGVIAAVSIMAFSPWLIYHSVEAKQYATELLVTTVILYLYTYYKNKISYRSKIIWGFWGAITIWFSFSAVFVLAGIALVLLIDLLRHKRWARLPGYCIVATLWFGSFVVNYLTFSGKDAHSGWLVDFYVKHDAFMPLSLKAFPWMSYQLFTFLDYPMGLSWFTTNGYDSRIHQLMLRVSWLPAIFSIAGAIYLTKRNRKLLLIIVAVFVIVFLASAVKLYPFHERLTVFLAPLFMLLAGAGCQLLSPIKISRGYHLQYLAVLLLLAGPVVNSLNLIFRDDLFGGYKRAYHRDALLYLNKHYKPGDLVYVYWNDLPAYRFYKATYNLRYTAVEGTDYRFTVNNLKAYFIKLNAELQQSPARRTWVIQNDRFDISIGNYIGLPKWYYAVKDVPSLFHKQVLSMGKPLDNYTPGGRNGQSTSTVVLIAMSKPD